MILTHGFELLEVLPLSDLYGKYADHDRLTVFANKGLECASCDRAGTLLLVTQETAGNKRSRKRNTVGAIHVDVYTDDFVLMTVDHITPKYIARQLGWTDEQTESLDNKQPMCDPCNNSKGSKHISNEQLRKNRRNANNSRIYGVEVIRSLVPNIHRLVGNTI